MGHVIMIEPQIRARRTMAILNPRDELRKIIEADMGTDVANLYDEVICELEENGTGDDYEAISDGYRNKLVDVMNELHEIVMQKRLNRDRLERLYERLNKEL